MLVDFANACQNLEKEQISLVNSELLECVILLFIVVLENLFFL